MYGKIDISEDVVAAIVGIALTECDGIVGTTSQRVKDHVVDFFKKENTKKGIIVKIDDQSSVYQIDVFVAVKYGVSISEIALKAQTYIQSRLHDMIDGFEFHVNLFVTDVKTVN